MPASIYPSDQGLSKEERAELVQSTGSYGWDASKCDMYVDLAAAAAAEEGSEEAPWIAGVMEIPWQEVARLGWWARKGMERASVSEMEEAGLIEEEA